MLQVPDVEGSKEERCELTRTSYGRRFINEVSSVLWEIIINVASVLYSLHYFQLSSLSFCYILVVNLINQ